MRLLTASIAVLVLAGCASQPNESMEPSAPAATPVAAANATPEAKVTDQPGATATTDAVKVYPGYKAKQKNGVTMYCKKVGKIGSNFSDEMCLTAADMERLYDRAEEDREAFRRNQTICGSGSCGGR